MSEKQYILSYYQFKNEAWDYIEEAVSESNRGKVLDLILPKNVNLDAVCLKEVTNQGE